MSYSLQSPDFEMKDISFANIPKLGLGNERDKRTCVKDISSNGMSVIKGLVSKISLRGE